MGYKFESEEDKIKHYKMVKKMAQDRYKKEHKEEAKLYHSNYYHSSGLKEKLKIKREEKAAQKKKEINQAYDEFMKDKEKSSPKR